MKKYSITIKVLCNRWYKYCVKTLKAFVKEKILKFRFRKASKFDFFIHKKSVLLVELNNFHAELIPGSIKYFQDLGYNVDVFLRYENYAQDVFARWKNILRICVGDEKMLKNWLNSDAIKQYDYVFFSSLRNLEQDFPKSMPLAKNGCLFIHHNPQQESMTVREQVLKKQNRIFCLNTVKFFPQLNPHYFGEIKITRKNINIVKFLVIGEVNKNRKNHSLIIDATRELLHNKIENFKIIVIGAGKMKIPSDVVSFIERKGKLSFLDMFVEIESADFILGLLDPFNLMHKDYLIGKTTGNLQLSYGFLKPFIINEIFGHHYGLSSNSAILYPNNTLADAMADAVKMEQLNYKNMQQELEYIARAVYRKSLANLKSALNFNREK